MTEPEITPDLMSYFFIEKSSILEEMSDKERLILKSLYPQSNYKLIFNRFKTNLESKNERPEVRVEASCFSRIVPLDKDTSLISLLGIDMQVRNISYSGLMGYTEENLLLNQSFQATIEIGLRRISCLEIQVCWKSGFGHYGFKILKSDESWNEVVSYSISFISKDQSA